MLEQAIQNLADAINNLAAAYGTGEAQLPVPTPETEARPTRGRKAKTTDTPDAGAAGQPGSGDTAQPAPASTRAPADAQASAAATVVDAGTGQPLDAAAYRKEVKGRAGALTTIAGGNDKLAEIIKKHSPAGTEVKMGSVPDSALQAFDADVATAMESLKALAD